MAIGQRYSSKYLWIRLALFEKQLAKIVEYLVNNSSKYYEKDVTRLYGTTFTFTFFLIHYFVLVVLLFVDEAIAYRAAVIIVACESDGWGFMEETLFDAAKSLTND